MSTSESALKSAQFSRRALGCGAIAATASLLAGTTRPSSAAEALVRKPGKWQKLSLAAYSFNKVLPKSWTRDQLATASFSLDRFIDFCAEQNLDGCELTSYYFPKEVTTDYLNNIKNQTFRLGLDISGTAIGNNFCLPEGEKRKEQLELTKSWIDYAATMGAPVIRIFAGVTPKGDTEEAALERCIDGINQSLEYAAAKGVFLALENHGGITATPAQLLRIVNGVKSSPWFGINFDGGNFHSADPYRELEEIAPYAINAQIKMEIVREGKKEPADLKRVVSILKKANYCGYIVLEYEAEEDPFQAVPRHLKELRGLLN